MCAILNTVASNWNVQLVTIVICNHVHVSIVVSYMHPDVSYTKVCSFPLLGKFSFGISLDKKKLQNEIRGKTSRQFTI